MELQALQVPLAIGPSVHCCPFALALAASLLGLSLEHQALNVLAAADIRRHLLGRYVAAFEHGVSSATYERH
jgi:hypothetical protein